MKDATVELKSVDADAAAKGDFVAVTKRISDITQSMALHRRIVKDNEARDQRRATVLNHHNGNPPVPKWLRKKNGDTWKANIPFREHESKHHEMAATFNDLDDRVPTIPKVRCDFTSDRDVNIDYGNQLSQCYHTLLTRGWTGYVDEKEAAIDELINFGYFTAFWPDDDSFQWIHLKTNQVLVPSGTMSNQDKWDFVEIRMTYTVHDLYKRISDPEQLKSSEDVGWDADNIKLAIMRSSTATLPKGKDKWQLGDWTDFEQKLQNNDVAYNAVDSNPIRCAHQLVKEMNGNIRRLIIFEDEDLPGYLYDKETEETKFERFIQIIYFGVDTFFHGHRGLGEKIYNLTLMIDILGNEAIDTTRLDQAIFFKGRANSENRKLKFSRFMFLNDLEIAENRVGESAGNAIAMSRYLNQKMNSNVALADNVGDRESVQPVSAQEATLNSLRRTGIQKTHINRFYRGMDKILKEMWRRINFADGRYSDVVDGWQARKDFYNECDRLGIPRDAISFDTCRVLAFRSIGHGSAGAEDIATAEIMGMNQFMRQPEQVQKAFHNRVAAITNWETAEEFFPISEDTQQSDIEDTLISMMLNDLREGTAVAVERRQNHAKHARAIIIMLGEEINNKIEQDPVGLLQVMSPSMSKLGSHMDWMRRIPSFTQDLDELQPDFNSLLEVFNNVRQTAVAIVEEQQRQAETERIAIEEALANKPDDKVMKVLADARNDTLAVQLKHRAKMTDVANKHTERLTKIAFEVNEERNERIAKANAVSQTPAISTRPQVPQTV